MPNANSKFLSCSPLLNETMLPIKRNPTVHLIN
uniref:Uncharacterized protein n=1 Tax=Arundo donax TaxID=35708 RepID=A0A0A9CDL5_ARUDO